jgi:hypothetical protein
VGCLHLLVQGFYCKLCCTWGSLCHTGFDVKLIQWSMSRISRLAFAVLILALLAPSASSAKVGDFAPNTYGVSAHVSDQLHTAVFAKSDRHRIKAAQYKHWALPASLPQATVLSTVEFVTASSTSFTPKPAVCFLSCRAPPSNTSQLS